MNYRKKILSSLKKEAVAILEGSINLNDDSEYGPYVSVYVGKDEDAEVVGGGDSRKGRLMLDRVENSLQTAFEPLLKKLNVEMEAANNKYQELRKELYRRKLTGEGDIEEIKEELKSLRYPAIGDYLTDAVEILKSYDNIKNIMPKVDATRGSKGAVINFVYEATGIQDDVFYVNVYEAEQNYGGPEEGGWYYTQNYPVSSTKVDSYKEAIELQKKLEVDIEQNNAIRGAGKTKVQPWAENLPDDWEPSSQQEDESTVYYEGTEFVTIESHPAKQPGPAPRYSALSYRKKIMAKLKKKAEDLSTCEGCKNKFSWKELKQVDGQWLCPQCQIEVPARRKEYRERIREQLERGKKEKEERYLDELDELLESLWREGVRGDELYDGARDTFGEKVYRKYDFSSLIERWENSREKSNIPYIMVKDVLDDNWTKEFLNFYNYGKHDWEFKFPKAYYTNGSTDKESWSRVEDNTVLSEHTGPIYYFPASRTAILTGTRELSEEALNKIMGQL